MVDSSPPNVVVIIAENGTSVTRVVSTSLSPNASLLYSISGGADAALFEIDPATGALSFKAAPNFEAPADLGGLNVYNVEVQVSDGTLIDTQKIEVTVSNVNEAPAILSPLSVNEAGIGAGGDNIDGVVVPLIASTAGAVLTGVSGVLYFQYAYSGIQPVIFKATYVEQTAPNFGNWNGWDLGRDITPYVSLAGTMESNVITDITYRG